MCTQERFRSVLYKFIQSQAYTQTFEMGGGGVQIFRVGWGAGANAKKMPIWGPKESLGQKLHDFEVCVCACVQGGGGLVCTPKLPLHTGLFRIFTGNTLYSKGCL